MTASPVSQPMVSQDPGQTVQVWAAEDIFVSLGVNQDDPIGGPFEVVLEDQYMLDPAARPRRLVMTRPDGRAQIVAPGSAMGRPGDTVRLVARYTMMAPDGDRVEVLLLDMAGQGAALPLSPMEPGLAYMLVSVDPDPGEVSLADILSLSFARGTMITMGDGSQRAIETLEPGDLVLTRDHGRKALRWIGQARMRATGHGAPVVISARTLGNEGDLILGQHHRVFLYQRKRVEGLATSELLVEARDLVDGTRVFIREGGWTDYFSLIFDDHEIIYAEGIPSESLLVTETMVNHLPADLAAEVKAQFPGLRQTQHFGTEAGRQALDAIGPSQLFRQG